jgi:PPOX class probable F420-dependent enzyme
MAEMTPEALDTFLRETRIAKLAYLQASGAPTIVPVWFEWDGKVARVFTSRRSPKVKRLEADNRVALAVEELVGVPERWATIEGTVTIAEEGVIPLIERLARRYYAPDRAAEAIKSWSANPDMWVVLTVTPERIRSGA